MIISHWHRFLFIHIHKTGGTSIEMALEPFLHWNDLLLGSSHLGEAMNDAYRERFGLDKHSSFSDAERVCGAKMCEEYYSFSIVRHPLSRICSLYNFVGSMVNDWCMTNEVPIDVLREDIDGYAAPFPPLAWAASKVYISTDGFSQFIRHPDLAHDNAYDSQASRLRASTGQMVKEIFKLEERDVWAPMLRTRLNIDFELPHANKSAQQIADPRSVSTDDIVLIRERFSDDFDEFGYGIELK